MYLITIILTCDGYGCGKQIAEKTSDPYFEDGVQEIREKLRGQGVNLGVALCPDCAKKSHENLTTACHCGLCENRGE